MTVKFAPWFLLKCSRPVVFLTAALVVFSSAFAGDKIIFSGREGVRELPGSNKKQQLLEPTLGEFRPGSGGPLDGVLTPSGGVATGGVMDRRQVESQERRKNWIFQDPNELRTRLSEGGPAREADGTSLAQRPKSSMERFVEGKDAKNSANAELKTKDFNAPTPNGLTLRSSEQTDFSARTNPSEPTTAANAALARAGRELETGSSVGEFKVFNSFNRITTERRFQEREREREAQVAAFDRLINPAPLLAPSARGEAFGLGESVATTGAVLGPRGLPDVQRNDFINGGAFSGTPRFSGREDFNAKTPVNAGFQSSFIAPPEPLRVEPKPGVLEIPKRKF